MLSVTHSIPGSRIGYFIGLNLIVFIALILVGSCVSRVSAAVPVSWKATGYGINASGMTLAEVLQEFSTTYGVKLQNSTPAGISLHGRFQASNGSEFLNRLGNR
jgi:type III secretion protein C